MARRCLYEGAGSFELGKGEGKEKSVQRVGKGEPDWTGTEMIPCDGIGIIVGHLGQINSRKDFEEEQNSIVE